MKKIIALLTALLFTLNAFGYQFYTSGNNKYSDTSVVIDNLGTPVTNVITYSYQLSGYVPAATATDVLCVSGSATKVVKVRRIQVTAAAGSASQVSIYVYLRTAADTGGTSTTPAATKYDSTNPSPTAALTQYSANPTLGTGTLLSADYYEIPATTGNTYWTGPWIEDYGIRNSQPVILRGTSQSVCFNLGGQTLPSGFTLYTRIEWTEE